MPGVFFPEFFLGVKRLRFMLLSIFGKSPISERCMYLFQRLVNISYLREDVVHVK